MDPVLQRLGDVTIQRLEKPKEAKMGPQSHSGALEKPPKEAHESPITSEDEESEDDFPIPNLKRNLPESQVSMKKFKFDDIANLAVGAKKCEDINREIASVNNFSDEDMSEFEDESDIESEGDLNDLINSSAEKLGKEEISDEEEEEESFLDKLVDEPFTGELPIVPKQEAPDEDYDYDIKEKLKEMGEISFETVKKGESKPKKTEPTGENEVSVTPAKKPGAIEDEASLPKGINMRRNIREVMDETKLDEATLAAQRQEAERVRRVVEQQKILREYQRQANQERMQQKVISLLQGNNLNKPGTSSTTRIGNTVLVKLPNGQTKPMTKLPKRPFELLRVPKGSPPQHPFHPGHQPPPMPPACGLFPPVPPMRAPLPAHQQRSLLTAKKPGAGGQLTPSVSIAPVGKKFVPGMVPKLENFSETDSEGEDIKLPMVKPKTKDSAPVTTIDISSDDDCIVVSEPEADGPDDSEDDPSNSGMHTNDEFNQPDERGRVLVNVGHPDDEPDVFLAPQIARIIKPHQVGGVRFLYDNVIESTTRFESSSGFGCILAHSMGLGKTLQIVCFSDIFLRHTAAKTILCIMPINTLQNWMAEYNMWLPTEEQAPNSPLNAHGEVRARNFGLYVLNDSHKTLPARAKVIHQWRTFGGVLLIGYEQYRLLSLRKFPKSRRKNPLDTKDDDKNRALFDEVHEALVKPGPDLVICDEGHRIKNSHASISLALKQMCTKRRVVLTGYPLQNNLMEYWCMVDFVRPNYLGSKTEFCNMFERPIMNGQCIDSTEADIKLMRYRAHVLHSLLLGFVQRRSHAVLQTALPQKEEYVLLVRMSTFQRELYETFMNEVVRSQAVPNPLKAFAVCCKIWNHPDVLYNFLKKRGGDAVDIDLEEVAGAAVTPQVALAPVKETKARKTPARPRRTPAKGKNGKPAASVTPYNSSQEQPPTQLLGTPISASGPLTSFSNTISQVARESSQGSVPQQKNNTPFQGSTYYDQHFDQNAQFPTNFGRQQTNTYPDNNQSTNFNELRSQSQSHSQPSTFINLDNQTPAQSNNSLTSLTNLSSEISLTPVKSAKSASSSQISLTPAQNRQQRDFTQLNTGQVSLTPIQQNMPPPQQQAGYNQYQSPPNQNRQQFGNRAFSSNQHNQPYGGNMQQNDQQQHNPPVTYSHTLPGGNPENAIYTPGSVATPTNYNPNTQQNENFAQQNANNQQTFAPQPPQQPNFANQQNQQGWPAQPNQQTVAYNANQEYNNQQQNTYNQPAASLNYTQTSTNQPSQAQTPAYNQTQGQGIEPLMNYTQQTTGYSQQNQEFNQQGFAQQNQSPQFSRSQQSTPFNSQTTNQHQTPPNQQSAPFSSQTQQRATYPETFTSQNYETPGYSQQPTQKSQETFSYANQGQSYSQNSQQNFESGNFQQQQNYWQQQQPQQQQQEGFSQQQNTFFNPQNQQQQQFNANFNSNSNQSWMKKDDSKCNTISSIKSETSNDSKPKIKIISDIKLPPVFPGHSNDSKPKIKIISDIKIEPKLEDVDEKFELKQEINKLKNELKNELKIEGDSKSSRPTSPLPKLSSLVSTKEDTGIPYDWALELLKDYVPGCIENSAKMKILFCIIRESIALGDRLLVFSQSLITLDLIEQFLQSNLVPGDTVNWARNTSYYRLDGSTSALEREKLINEFNSNPKIHVFLVSTRAGSLGINLIGANRVVVLDASWNPCHDTQAVCRVYRYGQRKPCFVYRLVVDNCLEKKIYDRQVNKQGMSDRIVDECNPDAHLTMKDVSTLCWDDKKDEGDEKDWSCVKDNYIDVVLQKVLVEHGRCLNKEPFQHESLLVDRKEKQLSSQEKRLAKKGYEREKQASRQPSYSVASGRGHRPIASVRPMQQGERPSRWIPAEHWQRQGMTAQEMTLPLDVVIPTNQPEKGNIVLKAGQKVLVLKSPKGVYMQLESGKIVAIKTAIKVKGKAEESANDPTKMSPKSTMAAAMLPGLGALPPTMKVNPSISAMPTQKKVVKPFQPGVAKFNVRSIRQSVPNLVSRIQSVTKKVQMAKTKPYNVGSEIAKSLKEAESMPGSSSEDEHASFASQQQQQQQDNKPKVERLNGPEEIQRQISMLKSKQISIQRVSSQAPKPNPAEDKKKAPLEQLERTATSVLNDNTPFQDTLDSITRNFKNADAASSDEPLEHLEEEEEEEEEEEDEEEAAALESEDKEETHEISDHSDDVTFVSGRQPPPADASKPADAAPADYGYNYGGYQYPPYHGHPPPPQGYPPYPPPQHPPPYDAMGYAPQQYGYAYPQGYAPYPPPPPPQPGYDYQTAPPPQPMYPGYHQPYPQQYPPPPPQAGYPPPPAQQPPYADYQYPAAGAPAPQPPYYPNT
ncbi:unnamed protein product [Brassicogethes aeneus]|uniref:Helicase ARIP4 n=1 Tax=Brassicogethes aeneus TaxID=1431903 RepID=A0A9P0FFP6_BRAAE|nr:unnamed protein product [Brassicogethes aeneus]